MALRKIVVQGEECLTKVCRPVTEFNPHLHQLLDDMLETLEDANGAGLAAPQVGVLRRVCVVLDEDSEEYIELVNPEIVAQSGEQTGLEGCLSVPGKWGIVTRPENRDPMHQNSTVIFLRRSLNRLPTEGRPVSQANDLSQLYRRRLPLYQGAADLEVDNDGTVERTVSEIIRRLEL